VGDHLLAYAMMASGVDQSAQVDVMAFMQSSALVLISPVIASFFVGAVWLSVGFAGAGTVPRRNPGLYAVALGIAVVGPALATATALVDTRTVGILTLGTVAVAQAWLGSCSGSSGNGGDLRLARGRAPRFPRVGRSPRAVPGPRGVSGVRHMAERS
jgi:hypothetical protein